VLYHAAEDTTMMIDFKTALRTTVLLVDDDVAQLELRVLAMQMSGFSVFSAGSPKDAISIMSQYRRRKVDVAVLDYNMPGMNGCVLADYLRCRYPEMKIILYSGATDISENEMGSIDVFVPKSNGIGSLLAQISEFAETLLVPEAISGASCRA
jgi:DNA-binding NtrC family response regulator